MDKNSIGEIQNISIRQLQNICDNKCVVIEAAKAFVDILGLCEDIKGNKQLANFARKINRSLKGE